MGRARAFAGGGATRGSTGRAAAILAAALCIGVASAAGAQSGGQDGFVRDAFVQDGLGQDGFFTETDDGGARAAIDEIARSGQYQMELPPRRRPEPPPPRRDPIEPFTLSPTMQTLLIGLLVIVVLIVVIQLIRRSRLPERKAAGDASEARVTDAPPDAPSAAELRDAEAAALAAARNGDWDEAVHLLLLGAIGRLRERDARAAARSLTSREILARHFRAPERAEARTALAALVGAVEVSLFGGRAADEAGFERCLEAYRALRRALGNGARAEAA